MPDNLPDKPINKPRKKSTVKKLDFNVISERRLLDSKIILPQEEPHHRLAKFMLGAMILGGLAGAGVLFYLNTRNQAPESNYHPRITIPEDTGSKQPAAASPSAVEPPPPALVQVVEILRTPTNFLNVRKGPGTNFEKIGQVKPGEAYILVSADEAKGWYEIKLADGSTGWVTKEYAKVK